MDMHDRDLDLLDLDHPHNRGFVDGGWACGSCGLRFDTASQLGSHAGLLGRLARSSRRLPANGPRSFRHRALRTTVDEDSPNPCKPRRSTPPAPHRPALTPPKRG